MVNKGKKTLVVNLIGSPGTGKSSTSYDLMAKLKWLGVDCEHVSEFAKELVWEERQCTFQNELYIFAKQAHRLFRVNSKVDIIVTDRPLILSCYYEKKYGQGDIDFQNVVKKEFDKYENLNIFLKRTKPYNPNGRNQSEKESDEMRDEIRNMLLEKKVDFIDMDSSKENVSKILEIISSKRPELNIMSPMQNLFKDFSGNPEDYKEDPWV